MLTFQISIDESLPNQLCKECVNKIEQLDEFCTRIKENEIKLHHYLGNGTLQDYYLKLTNDIHVKEEKYDSIIFCESKYLINEDYYDNGVLEEDIRIEKREDNKSINFDECDNMKIETSADDCNKTTCSSDDEITLSSIKKDKETNAPVKASKKIEKVRPEKSSNIKNIKEANINTDLKTDNVKQFTCLTCHKLCDSQTELIKHYHNEHMNKTHITVKHKYTETEIEGNITYKCDSCDKTCKNKKDIIKHFAVHNEERPLICTPCGKK